MDLAALGIVVKTTGVEEAEHKLDRLGRTGASAAREAQKVTPAVDSIGKAAKRTAAPMDAAARSAASLRASFAGLGAVLSVGTIATAAREFVRLGDAFANDKAKLSLLVQEQGNLLQVQGQLFLLSQRTAAEVGTTTDLYVKLGQSSQRLATNQGELLRVTELVNKALVLSGADAATSAATVRQFAQALSAGALRGDEFVSVMEGGPRLAKALADGLNLPIGKLRELAGEGKLTADVVTDAILASGKQIDAEFGKLPLTVGRAVQQVRNSLGQLVGSADDASGATSELADSIHGLAGALEAPGVRQGFTHAISDLVDITRGAVEAYQAIDGLVGKFNQLQEEAGKQGRNTLRQFGVAGNAVASALDLYQATHGRPRPNTAGKEPNYLQLPGYLTGKQDFNFAEYSQYMTPGGRTIAPALPAGDAKKTGTRKVRGPAADDGSIAARAHREAEEAARRMTEAQEEALRTLQDWRAEIEGPAAQALLKYSRLEGELDMQFAAGEVSAKAYAEGMGLVAKMRERELAEIEARRTPAQQMLDDIRFEFELTGLSNAAREKAIALRQANVSAMSAEGQALVENIDRLQKARDSERVIGDLKGMTSDFAASAITDFRNIGDEFEDFAKRLQRYAAQMLADKAIQWLANLFMGGAGTYTGNGTGPGSLTGFGNNTGWLTTGLSGGGYTGPGGKYQPAGVVHKGEVVFSQSDVARNGGVAAVEAMRLGLRGYAMGGIVGGSTAPSGRGFGNVIINAPAGSTATTEERDRGDGSGVKDLVVFIENTARGVWNKDLATGQGMARSLQQTFGLSRQGVQRG